MNKSDVKTLLVKISAYKPAQQFNLLTAAAWHEALADIPFEDASRAVTDLAEEVDYIGVNDVVKRVKHYRAARIDAGFGALIPPPECRDHPDVYLEWSREARRRLGNGESADDISGVRTSELPQRNLRELLGPR